MKAGFLLGCNKQGNFLIGKKSCIFAGGKRIVHNAYYYSNHMDNNLKTKIDELVGEIAKITDLHHRIDILNYMEQQSSYMLWLLEDELHIDNDSHNV